MALNKREKIIAGSLAGLLLLVGANSLLIKPYLAERAALVDLIDSSNDKNNKADKVLANRDRVADNWKTMMTNGLKTKSSDAEIATVRAFYDWSQSARVTIESVKSDQAEQVGDFQQVRITATVLGSMAGIARWLWSLETSPLPVQVGDVQLNTRKDGVDDLNMQITVTTLAFVPPPPKTGTANNTAGAK